MVISLIMLLFIVALVSICCLIFIDYSKFTLGWSVGIKAAQRSISRSMRGGYSKSVLCTIGVIFMYDVNILQYFGGNLSLSVKMGQFMDLKFIATGWCGHYFVFLNMTPNFSIINSFSEICCKGAINHHG